MTLLLLTGKTDEQRHLSNLQETRFKNTSRTDDKGWTQPLKSTWKDKNCFAFSLSHPSFNMKTQQHAAVNHREEPKPAGPSKSPHVNKKEIIAKHLQVFIPLFMLYLHSLQFLFIYLFIFVQHLHFCAQTANLTPVHSHTTPPSVQWFLSFLPFNYQHCVYRI